MDPLDEIEPEDYYQAREELARIIHWYNHERLHSALNYLTPADYHSCDPEKRLEERREKIRLARERRRERNLKMRQMRLVCGQHALR